MRSVLFLLVSVLIISGCKKQRYPYPCTAVKNGNEWLGNTRSEYSYSNDRLYIEFYQEVNRCVPGNGCVIEGISVGNLKKTAGRSILMDQIDSLSYTIDDTITRARFATLNGDVGCDWYKINYNDSSWINTETVDESKNIIKGSFNLSFVFDTSFGRTKCDPQAPDFIVFTNGRFISKYTVY